MYNRHGSEVYFMGPDTYTKVQLHEFVIHLIDIKLSKYYVIN